MVWNRILPTRGGAQFIKRRDGQFISLTPAIHPLSIRGSAREIYQLVKNISILLLPGNAAALLFKLLTYYNSK